MQPSRSDLIHSISLLLQDYPDGLSKQQMDSFLILEKKKIIFFCPGSCSTSGMELMVGALDKGLKLKQSDYQIIVGQQEFDNFISSAKPDTFVCVQFGGALKDSGAIFVTDSPDELAADRVKKKIFWDKLQGLFT